MKQWVKLMLNVTRYKNFIWKKCLSTKKKCVISSSSKSWAICCKFYRFMSKEVYHLSDGLGYCILHASCYYNNRCIQSYHLLLPTRNIPLSGSNWLLWCDGTISDLCCLLHCFHVQRHLLESQQLSWATLWVGGSCSYKCLTTYIALCTALAYLQ